MEPIRDGLQLLDVHRIPGEIHRVGQAVSASAKIRPGNDESRALTLGHVLGRRGDDSESLAADDMLQLGPGFHAVHCWAGGEIIGTVRRGVDAAAVEELAADGVEVIFMVLVAEEHGVDDGELVQTEGWVVGDFEDDATLFPGGASGREKGVSEEADAVNFEDGGCGADMGDV